MFYTEDLGLVNKSASASLNSRKACADIMAAVYNENPSHWPNGLNLDQMDGGCYLVREASTHDPVGFVGWQERHEGKQNVGYYSVGLLPDYRRNGYAKEAVSKVIAEKSANVDVVRALVKADNNPSLALANRLGVSIVKKAGIAPSVLPAVGHAPWKKMLGFGLGNAAVWDYRSNDWGQKSPLHTSSWDKTRTINALLNGAIGVGGAELMHQGHGAGGITAMAMSPVKDLATAGIPLTIDTNKAVNEFRDKMHEPTPTVDPGMSTGQKLLAGGLLLGGGLYGIKKLTNALGGLAAAQDAGRVKVTLPTMHPGDGETTVDVPLHNFGVSDTLYKKVHRDTRRKLLEESKERQWKHKDGKLITRAEKGDKDLHEELDAEHSHLLANKNASATALKPIEPIQISNAVTQQKQQQQEQQTLDQQLAQQSQQQKAEDDQKQLETLTAENKKLQETVQKHETESHRHETESHKHRTEMAKHQLTSHEHKLALLQKELEHTLQEKTRVESAAPDITTAIIKQVANNTSSSVDRLRNLSSKYASTHAVLGWESIGLKKKAGTVVPPPVTPNPVVPPPAAPVAATPTPTPKPATPNYGSVGLNPTQLAAHKAQLQSQLASQKQEGQQIDKQYAGVNNIQKGWDAIGNADGALDKQMDDISNHKYDNLSYDNSDTWAGTAGKFLSRRAMDAKQGLSYLGYGAGKLVTMPMKSVHDAGSAGGNNIIDASRERENIGNQYAEDKAKADKQFQAEGGWNSPHAVSNWWNKGPSWFDTKAQQLGTYGQTLKGMGQVGTSAAEAGLTLGSLGTAGIASRALRGAAKFLPLAGVNALNSSYIDPHASPAIPPTVAAKAGLPPQNPNWQLMQMNGYGNPYMDQNKQYNNNSPAWWKAIYEHPLTQQFLGTGPNPNIYFPQGQQQQQPSIGQAWQHPYQTAMNPNMQGALAEGTYYGYNA